MLGRKCALYMIMFHAKWRLQWSNRLHFSCDKTRLKIEIILGEKQTTWIYIYKNSYTWEHRDYLNGCEFWAQWTHYTILFMYGKINSCKCYFNFASFSDVPKKFNGFVILFPHNFPFCYRILYTVTNRKWAKNPQESQIIRLFVLYERGSENVCYLWTEV